MSIMITGGAGFVGLNIIEHLLDDGHDVVSFGLEPPPPAFLAAVSGKPGSVHAVVGDVRDADALRNTMSSYGVRSLIHGAAITAGLQREESNPQSIAEVNFLGTLQVLEAARSQGVGRVVQLGSGAVFGRSVKRDGYLDEVNDTPVPDSLYGITKYAAERLGVRYRDTGRLDLVVARLGTCFGRWEYDTGVRDTLSIPFHLTRLAEQGERAVLFDSLPDDWVYASDVAHAVAGLLFATSLPAAVYQVSAGMRWPAIDWCAKLKHTYPQFQFEVSNDRNKANIGVAAPTPRPPFSIERLKNDTGYVPRYLLPEAFEDYMLWRRLAKAKV